MKKECILKTLVFGIILMCLNISTALTITSSSFEKYSSMISLINNLNSVTKNEFRGVNATLDGVKGENGWFVDIPVYLIITPDSGTQIVKVCICINNGAVQEIPYHDGEPYPLFFGVEILDIHLIIYDSEWNEYHFYLEYKVDIFLPTIVLQKENMFFNKLKFIADASDDISGVWRVEFYLDDNLKFTDYDSPFEWIWRGTGNHTVTAKVFDWAGLSANSSLNTFSVKSRSQNLQIILLLQNLILHYQMRNMYILRGR